MTNDDQVSKPGEQLVRLKWQQVDDEYRAYFEEHEGPDCVRCHTAHCCRQLVLCTLQEAEMIRAEVRRWPQRKYHDLLERLKRLPLKAKADFDGDCPFLVRERCQIYDLRPVACRAFHSTNKARCRRRVRSPVAELFTRLSNRNRELRDQLAGEDGGSDVVVLPIWLKLHIKD